MEENEQLKLFKSCESLRDLAKALGVRYGTLCGALYKPSNEKYINFEFLKRNGEKRQISAPIKFLKHIQRTLATLLQELYPHKRNVHGFLTGKNIKTNSHPHCRNNILINIDLKDFFPTIHFGRVKGIFEAQPFNFNNEVAKAIANLCCHNSVLPQGAPTSPIISNFVCRKLDNALWKYAKKYRFCYTRYADDLSFSSNERNIPPELGKLQKDKFILSKGFEKIITDNGFTINERKTHCSQTGNRKEVTGIIVNEKLNVSRKYVRKVRALLHSWEKAGLEEATRKHFDITTSEVSNSAQLAFSRKIVGMIHHIRFVRHQDNDENFVDTVYEGLRKRLQILMPDLIMPRVITEAMQAEWPTVLCEGHTDPLHLHAALRHFQSQKQFLDLDVRIIVYPESAKGSLGDSVLRKECDQKVRNQQIPKCKNIYLFDRDVPTTVKWAQENNTGFKRHAENIFTAVLPVPAHRNFEQICIEHYYKDNDLKILNKSNRRLFLLNEFDKQSGYHINEPGLKFSDLNMLINRNYNAIIDSNVTGRNGRNIAASKSSFAKNISKKNKGFENVDFEHFRSIFELLQEILTI